MKPCSFSDPGPAPRERTSPAVPSDEGSLKAGGWVKIPIGEAFVFEEFDKVGDFSGAKPGPVDQQMEGYPSLFSARTEIPLSRRKG